MSYAIRYTISAFSGAYALKYSVTIHHAECLNGLLTLAKADPCLAGFAAGGAVRQYDGYDAFNAIMKVVKYMMKVPSRTFCTKIELVQGNQVIEDTSFSDADEAGVFEVAALGKKGMLKRGDDVAEFDEITGKNGVYRAHVEPMAAIFKEDLLSLLNLCEQAMSSNAQLIATQVSNETPCAAPLIQI